MKALVAHVVRRKGPMLSFFKYIYACNSKLLERQLKNNLPYTYVEDHPSQPPIDTYYAPFDCIYHKSQRDPREQQKTPVQRRRLFSI